MMTKDKVFEQAVEYLENSGELPKSVTNKFLAACLLELHSISCANEEKLKTHNTRITRVEVLLGVNGLGVVLGLLKFFNLI